MTSCTDSSRMGSMTSDPKRRRNEAKNTRMFLAGVSSDQNCGWLGLPRNFQGPIKG